jgi:rod shape-determining protein MreC
VALTDIRQRSGFLFLAVLLGHVLLISAQVNSRTGTSILETVVFGVFAEVQRSLSSPVSSVRQAWIQYVGLRRVKAENDELKQQLAAARVELQEQRALADRSQGLEQLLDLREQSSLKTTPAQIIASGASPDFKTLTIDKGTRDGLRRDLAVVAPAGVVGRVVMPAARAAKIQLLIDRNAAAGALVERSRAQGVVTGRGDDRLQLDYVSEVSDVLVGDTIVTSGIDAIFPKGFVIGKVESIEKAGGAYRRIIVKPAVDFSGLEDVLVILTPTPAREAREGGLE